MIQMQMFTVINIRLEIIEWKNYGSKNYKGQFRNNK